MRELKVVEIAEVSGAGFIADFAENVGGFLGKIIGQDGLGKEIGASIGSFIESIPGVGFVNDILGKIFTK
ncbi:hypothetical protein PMPD1_4340 [Paramixta manurensis]|uniref:Uncharacterized protein n=1 Tax=Paramixta manurensis TaxID=2740817 RepID=A0A6M8UH58_9GAMM|nr:hypothetical protein PMPD1_4340 [Erwiniaceae bacterium PD-1]